VRLAGYHTFQLTYRDAVAPILVRTGRAVGIQLDPVNFPNIYSYWGLSFTSLDELVNSPSPRYWLLWPGILMMLVASLVELAANVTPIIISESRVPLLTT
jgi:hypothetical protein